MHDIHGDGEEADVEEINDDDDDDDGEIDIIGGASQEDHFGANTGGHNVVSLGIGDNATDGDSVEADRPLVNDMSMDGDIEDVDGEVGDRRFQNRPSLFNKLTGAEQQSSVDSEHHFKKKSGGGAVSAGGSKQFPLNQMRRRQSGSMGQGLNQIQINMSGERPANLTGSF